MERRAHWSDDLIDAVRDAVDVEFDDIWKLSEDSIRAVIAAVEDWLGPVEDMLRDANAAQAAEKKIQAVRDVYEDYFHDRSEPRCRRVPGSDPPRLGWSPVTPAWPWALALTIALGALIVSQVQLHEARDEVHRLRALLSDVTRWGRDWGRSE